MKDRIHKKTIIDWYRNFKLHLKCCLCPEKRVVELHHLERKNKEFCIYEGVKNGFSMKRLQEEAQKTIPLCPNHHKLVHLEKLNKKELLKWQICLSVREKKMAQGIPAFNFEEIDAKIKIKKIKRRKNSKLIEVSSGDLVNSELVYQLV